MTTQPFREDQHPRSGDGTFSTKEHDESAPLALVPPTRFPALGTWEVDDSYPPAQANDLEKVVSVCDIVDAGADTSEAIASALGMSGRQGDYYASAAGYLGLVTIDRSTTPATWHTTGVGDSMVCASSQDRAAMLAEMIPQLEPVQTLRAEGAETLAKHIQIDGYDETTARRRVDTMRAWADATGDQGAFTSTIDGERHLRLVRIDDAVALAAEARRIEREKAEKPPAICPGCFMALPVTGVCDTCD